jgi:hypothetical protein
MSRITREIHIEAAPEVVRRLVTDTDGRGTWLDLPLTGPTARPDGGVTFERHEPGRPPSRVDIEVSPDSSGTRVRVTERIAAPAQPAPRRRTPQPTAPRPADPRPRDADDAQQRPPVDPDGPVARALVPVPGQAEAVPPMGVPSFAPLRVGDQLADHLTDGAEEREASRGPWCLAAAA